MAETVYAALKGVDDDSLLSEEVQGINALESLIIAYSNYRARYDATLPLITLKSTGVQLKEALTQIPVLYRIKLLSMYLEALEKEEKEHGNAFIHTEQDESNHTEHYPEILEVKRDKSIDESLTQEDQDMEEFNHMKETLLKYVVLGFILLAALIVGAITYTSVLGVEHNGETTFGSIINAFVEIFKVLVGI